MNTLPGSVSWRRTPAASLDEAGPAPVPRQSLPTGSDYCRGSSGPFLPDSFGHAGIAEARSGRPLAADVEPHRTQDHEALHDVLERVVDPRLVQPLVQNPDDRGPEQG